MSELSTSPLHPGPSEDSSTNHFPYRAYIKVVPSQGDGRRWEYIRDLQKIADTAEDLLIADDFNIATPLAYTPQIGQAPARLTIVGFLEADAATYPNTPPTTAASRPGIIHSGTVVGEKTSVMYGYHGGDLSQGQEPTAQVETLVAALKADIETSLSGATMSSAYPDFTFTVFFMDFNGVKFGSLPNKKAFRSFPS